MDLDGFELFLLFIVLSGLLGGIAYYFDKRRREALMEVAKGLGFKFQPTVFYQAHDAFGPLPLFTRGNHRNIRNWMEGEMSGYQINLFGYHYTQGHGKNSQTFTQSVALLRSDKLDLPAFAMRPEGLFDKLGDLFGSGDIDFDSHPAFSKRYLLKGEPAEQVRRLFTPPLLTFFEANPGLCVEGRGELIIVYRANKRVAPKAMQAFLREALRVAEQVRSAAR